MSAPLGRFVAFEGGDASGKTTQARLLAARWGAVLTREPGGTEVGEILRRMVLEPDHALHVRTEALLIAAARAQHVAEVIGPTLAAGTDVVCDRFTASSLVYQGIASGIGIDAVRAINRFATGELWPDLTVLVDLPVDIARARLGREGDRFETEAADYHERVRQGYLALAAAEHHRWLVVDGSLPIDELATAVEAGVARLAS